MVTMAGSGSFSRLVRPSILLIPTLAELASSPKLALAGK
jgi:hypothetical protein